MAQTIKIALPQILKVENTSDRALSFVPYRENFVSVLDAGKAFEFQVKTAGQALYYLEQNKTSEGLVVSQLAAFDLAASETLSIFKTPAVMTLENTSAVIKTFAPYKENFTVDVAAGDKYEIEAETLGQILYYMAQATEGLDVSYAAKA